MRDCYDETKIIIIYNGSIVEELETTEDFLDYYQNFYGGSNTISITNRDGYIRVWCYNLADVVHIAYANGLMNNY